MQIESLAAHVIGKYLEIFFPKMKNFDESYLTGKTRIRDHTEAGLWIELPLIPELLLPTDPPSRIWGGAYARLNGSVIADVLLYIEDRRIVEIEFASALEDFPRIIETCQIISSMQ
jgi:hypothetical protein